MKHILAAILSLVVTSNCFGQSNFIQIETNKTLGLFSFLETSSGQLGTSNSLREYITDSYQQDKAFNNLIEAYANLKLDYSFKRQEFPEKRASYTATKDLLWIAASNSNNIDDFSQRIIGYLPHQTHVKFIELLKKTENYYDDLIWDKEQKNILRIQNQLDAYKDQIGDLYLRISQFYNTSWNTSIPFKIVLYPIPLIKGHTTAIPKGNALICGFLSHNENEYKSLLGIIIHEMCHILYREQNPEFQTQIDQWFTHSSSLYASVAYSFIDEGLATALGNGWAYKQIHNILDSNEWYNNKHIDGFAHALFPLVEQYVHDRKSIDQNFIDKSIGLFKQTFPKAVEETAILMNSLQLFANTEEEVEINKISGNLYRYFNIRSMSFSTPILSKQSKERFGKNEITKLFIVDSDNANTLVGLQKSFPNLKIQTPLNTLDIFKDEKTKSTLIIMNINGLEKLSDGYKTLSSIPYLENGKNYKIK